MVKKSFVIFKSDFMSRPVVRVVVGIVGQRPKDEVGAETKFILQTFLSRLTTRLSLKSI